jgi:hypothetical protein
MENLNKTFFLKMHASEVNTIVQNLIDVKNFYIQDAQKTINERFFRVVEDSKVRQARKENNANWISVDAIFNQVPTEARKKFILHFIANFAFPEKLLTRLQANCSEKVSAILLNRVLQKLIQDRPLAPVIYERPIHSQNGVRGELTCYLQDSAMVKSETLKFYAHLQKLPMHYMFEKETVVMKNYNYDDISLSLIYLFELQFPEFSNIFNLEIKKGSLIAKIKLP